MSEPMPSKSRGKRVVALLGALLVALAGLVYCVLQYFGGPGKLPLAKDTTYFTGPVDAEGYIDYAAALNDLLGKGISAEKNANVLLWQAFGPTPGTEKEMPAEFFERLGMKAPPREGDYFLDLFTYLRKYSTLEFEEQDAIYKQESWAGQRPWAAGEYPHIASWLKTNEKPLAVALEAVRRPDYFQPLLSRPRENEPPTLIGARFPMFSCSRELSHALTARALLRVNEGKFKEAWQDLLACHRLGRLMARGGTLIEVLGGITIDSVARTADLAFLERATLTSRQFQDLLKDLQELPPLPPLADKVDLGARCQFLDSLQVVRRSGFGILEGVGNPLGSVRTPDAEERKAMEQIDWAPILRDANRWFDRLAAALRREDRTSRQKELARIVEDLGELKVEPGAPLDKTRALGKGPPDQRAAKMLADLQLGDIIPAARQMQNSYDRTEQEQRNLHIAFALAAYRAEHGRYPAGLAELAPKYLTAIPNDLFSGGALIYRPEEKGYLLYSVGVNGQDEEGRSFGDDLAGDDLRIRLPLPELKRQK